MTSPECIRPFLVCGFHRLSMVQPYQNRLAGHTIESNHGLILCVFESQIYGDF